MKRNHSPDLPVLEPLTGPHESLPKILSHAREELSGYYHFPAECLLSLSASHPHQRKIRSERRANQIIVARTLLQYTSLVTMMVGTPSKGGFVPYSNWWLIKQAGIPSRCFESSLADLVRAGYVSSSRVVDHCGLSDRYSGYAIRTIRYNFLKELRISASAIAEDRQKATDRLRKKAWAEGSSIEAWIALPTPAERLNQPHNEPQIIGGDKDG